MGAEEQDEAGGIGARAAALDIRRILADGDLDGLASAAILRRVWPDAEVRLSHPAEVRSGVCDDFVGRDTAVLDLPFHADCGLYIDHHQTNRPSDADAAAFEAAGGLACWRDRLSAARVAFELFEDEVDLSGVAAWMPMIDALDGGRISADDLFSDDPVVLIGRIVSMHDLALTEVLLDAISSGMSPQGAVALPPVAERVAERQAEFAELRERIRTRVEVVDRLAIVRMEGEGIRTNGYLVTAEVGDACDACCIIHGDVDGAIGDPDRWPLSASFYTNSFLHANGGVFDLTRLATAFDVDGGGHANACGCRVQPVGDGTAVADGFAAVEVRPVAARDIERNLAAWLAEWAAR